MTLEQVADAIRAEMTSGRKFGEKFAGVEFGESGAKVKTAPVRTKRHLTPRQRKVEEYIDLAGGADDPANPETDLLALWVDCGGRLFDKMPFKFATHHSARSKTGVKRTRESVADEFGESGTFWDSLDNAERRIFFGTEKLEPGSIGEGFREALESAGITRFTAEDGTVDFDAAIAEFRRQWRNYERGERGLRERRKAQLEEEREEFERQEDEELEAIFGKEDKSLTPEQIAAVEAEIEASRAAGYFSRGNRDGRLLFARGNQPRPKDIAKEIDNSNLADSAKKQMRQIVRAYTDRAGEFKEGYGKIPGDITKPSNLGAFQWQQVRTENFRENFFGDWLSVKRRQLLDAAKSVPLDRSVGIKYDQGRRSAIKHELVEWARKTGFGGVYKTEVGDVQIDFHSVKTSFGHPRWTEQKLHAIYTLEEGFKNAVYLGSLDDQVHGNTVNHYFAYKVDDAGTPGIVFCRAQEDTNKNRLYLYEIYTEAEIAKSGTVKPGAIRRALTDSAAFGKIILNPLYAVNGADVSKVVDANGVTCQSK